MASLGFTPAKEQDFWIQKAVGASTSKSSSLSGKEARQFYESLTTENDVAGKSEHRQNQNEKDDQRNGGVGRITGSQTQRSLAHATVTRRNRSGEGAQRVGTRARNDRARGDHAGTSEQATSSRFAELNGLKLLRCAQEGDLSAIKDLLSRGADINFQDSFFWTAMMCACWAGQRAAVSLLLQHGAAWVGVVDTKGRDAMDLAKTAGHQGVMEELQSYGRSIQHDTRPDRSTTQAQLCGVCGSQYSDSLSSHLSSTLHQFSLRRPPPTPYYCLPPSSASYKMMVRCGWNPATGLGPQGGGPVQPVPTVLKRDQKGLGYGPVKKAKVTHFLAKDPQAVKSALKDREQIGDRGKRKEASMRQKEKDKTWEKDFRASFYL